AMILDGEGNIVDLAVWRYQAADIDSFNTIISTTIADFTVRGSSAFSGDGVAAVSGLETMQRLGSSDHDDKTDFQFIPKDLPPNDGLQNPGLELPVTNGKTPGLGFSPAATGFGEVLRTDLTTQMLDVNASLWTRVLFEVEEPSALDTLTLQIQYNDGFVAYLDGQELTSRNAPDSPTWDSTATAGRSVEESLTAEDIKVTAAADKLVAGTNVLAIHAMNVAADDDTFLLKAELSATSVEKVGRYFAVPTPGEPNEGAFFGYVEDTQFSVDRGFYDQPFQVEITTDTPDATIRYTTDGSKPSETNGQVYAVPISVTRTTVLRAVATKPGYRNANVDTQTYIFPDDVIRQSMMSTTITSNGVWGPQMRDALLALPTISLVSQDPVSLTESETSVELIFPDGSPGFQVDAGVEHYGGHSINYAKKSMRLSFKSIYGPKVEIRSFRRRGHRRVRPDPSANRFARYHVLR
ncbi:hypothetical protein LCGC14_2282010, partial [marine sediment metagenome]